MDYKNSNIMFNKIFKLFALIITICVVAGTVQSGLIPDLQQNTIVLAIMIGGDQNGTKLKRVYCPEYDDPDCLKGIFIPILEQIPSN